MGSEISKSLEQDAIHSLQGVVAEKHINSAHRPATASHETQEDEQQEDQENPTVRFRRNAQDVVHREQLFEFCSKWDLQKLHDFMIWYHRYYHSAASQNHAAAVSEEQNVSLINEEDQVVAENSDFSSSSCVQTSPATIASIETLDLTNIHLQVDQLEDEVRHMERMVEQLDSELDQERTTQLEVMQTSRPDSSSLTERSQPMLLKSPLSDMENQRMQLNVLLWQKRSQLDALRCHLHPSFDEIDVRLNVSYPTFLKAARQVHFQKRMAAIANSTQSWHPATMGFAMKRDESTKQQLLEFQQGDYVLPPLADHEIDGFTDDSASDSGKSADDEEDLDSDAEDKEDGQTGHDNVQEGGGGNNETNEATQNAVGVSERHKAANDDEDEDEEEEEEGDEAPADVTQVSSSRKAEEKEHQPSEDENRANDDAPKESSPDPMNPAAVDPPTSIVAETKSPAAVSISYRESLKRPRLIKRQVPESYDATKRNPIFFGYTLVPATNFVSDAVEGDEDNMAKENQLFDAKEEACNARLDAALAVEKGKLDAIAQRQALLKDQREKYWLKRQVEFQKAQAELDPNHPFFRSHAYQDKTMQEKEAQDDQEIANQQNAIHQQMESLRQQFGQELDHIRRMRSRNLPLGKQRIQFHESELDRFQSEVNVAKGNLRIANEENLALKKSKFAMMASDAVKRSQALHAETQIQNLEKELERKCFQVEQEMFLLARAQELFEEEERIMPLFSCLGGDDVTSDGSSGFALLDLLVALILGIGNASMQQKIRFLFELFATKGDANPSTSASSSSPSEPISMPKSSIRRSRNSLTTALRNSISHPSSSHASPTPANETKTIDRYTFMQILKLLFETLSKLGEFHPIRALNDHLVAGIADREFMSLGIDGQNAMTSFEFEAFCTEMIQRSKFLCEIMKSPWKHDLMSRFLVQSMSGISQFKLGMININDLKYVIAREMSLARTELSYWHKQIIHERALAQGENDPLKTDYSKYLPKRRSRLLSNVVPLDHFGYRNLLVYRHEVLQRASVRLQTVWRARKGRQVARLIAERQAFYHARGVALQEARDQIEQEWRAKDAKPGHTVEKMKFEAKIRMHQVKLRTKGHAFSREQVLALMIEEAVQNAVKEVENRFREMEEELGYLEHDQALHKPHGDMDYLGDISKALVQKVHDARTEKPEVGELMQQVRIKEEEAKAKKKQQQQQQQQQEQQQHSKDGQQVLEEASNSAARLEVPVATNQQVEEQHFVNQQDVEARQNFAKLRRQHMLRGEFPPELYQTGLTLAEQDFKLVLAFPDPPLKKLCMRLRTICDGLTDLKLGEFLQELPSKRHICDYVYKFRRFDGSFDLERMISDLYDHFRMVRSPETLAQGLVNVATSDIEFGVTYETFRLLWPERNESSLQQMITSQQLEIARNNEIAHVKKLTRAGFSADETEASRVIYQKEHHDLLDKQQRARDAHSRLVEALKAWREAELCVAELAKTQLQVQPEFPVLAVHRTLWVQRFRNAMRLPEANATQMEAKYTELVNVCSDFMQTATTIALVIVRELQLPARDKSLFPVTESSIDGRTDELVRNTKRFKYEAHNIWFKVLTDDHGRCEGSDEYASKLGGNELRNSALYLRTMVADPVMIPLQCCVDFMGFRVLCSAKVPIEMVQLSESGSIQSTSRQLVMGTNNRGKSVVFQSNELDQLMARAANVLNLSRHSVRGYQDLTSKALHCAADLTGYLTADSSVFALVNFTRALPPEDPEHTKHLIQSTRGMTILWRQLRPEMVQQSAAPLSPDALSCMTYGTPDWEEQLLNVQATTKKLVDEVIVAFAKKLSQRANYFVAPSFDLTHEMHRHGINMRHLGYLRSLFYFQLTGTVTLQYSTPCIVTTEDFTRELYRGWPIHLNGVSYQVSTNKADRFDANCITLNKPHMSDSMQNVVACSGRLDCRQHAAEVRNALLAEMVARTFKQLVRHFLRFACRHHGIGLPFAMKTVTLQCFNLFTGHGEGSEQFWEVHLFTSIRQRFGRCAISSVEKKNLRKQLVPFFHDILRRVCSMLGLQATTACWDRVKQFPDLYAFQLDDFVNLEAAYRIKHNMTILHFSMASLLLLQATLKQATSYRQLVRCDDPTGFWPLCERRGTPSACNNAANGVAFTGVFHGACVLEHPGPIVNEDMNRSVLFRKETRSFVAFKYHKSLYPSSTQEHVSLEVWCKAMGHPSTWRVVLTLGRFTLSAMRSNLWGFSINLKNVEIVASGTAVEMNAWTHLVGTFDGTCLRLFVNGGLTSEIDVENVVDQEIAQREEGIKKTREDITTMEDEAKARLYRQVDRDAQAFFLTKEGKRKIKSVSKQLLSEHEFRVRLARGGSSKANVPNGTKSAVVNAQTTNGADGPQPQGPEDNKHENNAGGSTVTPSTKKDYSKVTEADFEPLAKRNYIKEQFEKQVPAVLMEFKDLRDHLNMKIQKELEDQTNMHARALKIGALSSAHRKDGKHFFHGLIAQVAFYRNTALTRDQVNAHFAMGTHDRTHDSDWLFALASSRFAFALDQYPNDASTLSKFAQNICCSLKYDFDHRFVQDTYKKKVRAGLEAFVTTENANGIAEIIRNLPRDVKFSDLFIFCYQKLLKVDKNYFDLTASTSDPLGTSSGWKEEPKVLDLKQIARLPWVFFLGPQVSCLANVSDMELPVFADIICKVVTEYPTFYGDQLTSMRWLREVTNTKAVVYFILGLEAGEDGRTIDLSAIPDIDDSDLEVIAKNSRFCTSLCLRNCRLITNKTLVNLSVYCSQIEILEVSGCHRINDEALVAVGKNCRLLKRVDVAKCHDITDVGIEVIAKNNSRLQELNVSFCESITDRTLVTLGKSCPLLASLEMAFCVQITSRGLEQFAALVTNGSHLRRLDLSNCRRVGDDGILPLTRKCTRIQCLNVTFCDKLTDCGVLAITHNCLELESLLMEEVYRSTSQVFTFDQVHDGREIANTMMLQRLQHVTLTGCTAMNDMAMAYLGHRAPKLTSLTISSCSEITDQGIKWLLEDAFDHSRVGKCLQHLDFSYCPNLTSAGIHQVVVNCPDLTSLDLSGCLQLSDQDLSEIVKACRKLLKLGLGFCRDLTDEVLAVIGSHLYLEELNLARCVKITDQGMVEIIGQLTALKRINVSACRKLTDATLQALLDNSVMLQTVDVCHCGEFSQQLLDQLVQKRVEVITQPVHDDFNGLLKKKHSSRPEASTMDSDDRVENQDRNLSTSVHGDLDDLSVDEGDYEKEEEDDDDDDSDEQPDDAEATDPMGNAKKIKPPSKLVKTMSMVARSKASKSKLRKLLERNQHRAASKLHTNTTTSLPPI